MSAPELNCCPANRSGLLSGGNRGRILSAQCTPKVFIPAGFCGRRGRKWDFARLGQKCRLPWNGHQPAEYSVQNGDLRMRSPPGSTPYGALQALGQLWDFARRIVGETRHAMEL